MKQVLTTDDLTIMRKIHKNKTGLYIAQMDKQYLLHETQDANCFVLFDYFATSILNSAEEIEDKHIAECLSWSERKVADTRRKLINQGYLTFDTSKRTSDGMFIRIVYVGKVYNWLIQAGLPRNVLNHSAFTKMLKKFPLDNSTQTHDERMKLIQEMNEYFYTHPDEFK